MPDEVKEAADALNAYTETRNPYRSRPLNDYDLELLGVEAGILREEERQMRDAFLKGEK